VISNNLFVYFYLSYIFWISIYLSLIKIYLFLFITNLIAYILSQNIVTGSGIANSSSFNNLVITIVSFIVRSILNSSALVIEIIIISCFDTFQIIKPLYNDIIYL
jgi:hypothetical protein